MLEIVVGYRTPAVAHATRFSHKGPAFQVPDECHSIDNILNRSLFGSGEGARILELRLSVRDAGGSDEPDGVIPLFEVDLFAPRVYASRPKYEERPFPVHVGGYS